MRYSLFLLLLWRSSWCVAQETSALPDGAILHGRLAYAAPGDSAQLTYINSADAICSPAVALDARGAFTLRLPALGSPRYHSLFYRGDQPTPVYLTPGDELTLVQDARPPRPLHFSGRGANANNYLAQTTYTFEQGPAGSVPRPQDHLTATTTPVQLREQADAFRRARRAFLTAFARAHPLPVAFRQSAEEHLNLEWALTLLSYPTLYKLRAYRAPVLPPTYYNFLAQLPPHTLDPPGWHARSSADNGLVNYCLQFYGTRLVPSGRLGTDPAEGVRLCALAARELPNSATRDLALFMMLAEQLRTNLPGVQAAYPAFRAQCVDSSATRRLAQLIARREQALKITPGQTLAFTLPNEQGQSVSLADFKGKVVYLDFWGTWCAPCRAEMPASNALKQRFAGRDVVFLYVSVNDTPAHWQEGIASLQLTGPSSVHVRAPDRTVADAFGVTGYPAYLVIDRDGRIRLPVAPHPSAGEKISAALEQALRE